MVAGGQHSGLEGFIIFVFSKHFLILRAFIRYVVE